MSEQTWAGEKEVRFCFGEFAQSRIKQPISRVTHYDMVRLETAHGQSGS